MMDKSPFLSVIIPVHNDSKNLSQSLDALLASSYESYEIIVVDDCSTDASVEVSRSKSVKLYRLTHQSGPAAARNFGARKSRGDILIFVDSDVVVKPNTLEQIAYDFIENPEIVAVFGSYDDSPAADGVLSQFRNLLHHFIHQNSNEQANTFWAGCGAIYKTYFLKLKGFNEQMYSKPSIEDIELGIRLSQNGYKIMLDKKLQVKHLKQWNWFNWLKTDILNRAYPWSKLLIEYGSLTSDLNLKYSYRISSALAVILALAIVIIFIDRLTILRTGLLVYLIFFSTILLFGIVILNLDLYKFFYKKRGAIFILTSIPLHVLYYIYSGGTFTFCWIQSKLSRRVC
jgi:glycosyltransferase involved in cell wall biosynthesis